jgi:uncharacterized membrane protein YqjE
VDETSMTTRATYAEGATDGSAPHMAHSAGQVAGEMLRLMELQVELVKADARQSQRQFMAGLVWLILAAASLVAGVPMLLASVAYVLIDVVGLSRWAGLLIVGAAAVVVAVVAGRLGGLMLYRSGRAFQRSRDELAANLRWLKRTIGR